MPEYGPTRADRMAAYMRARARRKGRRP
jgi:hypothetical protein